jgi:hypothetical protein
MQGFQNGTKVLAPPGREDVKVFSLAIFTFIALEESITARPTAPSVSAPPFAALIMTQSNLH